VKRHLCAGSIWLLATGPIAAHAQAARIVPSFGTSVVFDDNVYHRPAAESDVSIRFSPRLDAVRLTDRLDLSGRLELDADRFARHQELTTAAAREAATFDLRYSASRRLSLTADASFTATETPADLNALTALTPGRARARRLLLHPSAAYSFGSGRGAELTVTYLLTADTLEGGVGATTQTASASVDRLVSARDGLRAEYVEQHFLFDTGQAAASRALTAEWTRDMDRRLTLTLRGGPRVTAGVLAPELWASARRALRAGSVSLSYQQTQTTLIGLAGIARTRSASASVDRAIGPRVTLRGMSAVVETRQANLPSRAFRVSGSCDWRFTPRLTFAAGYDTDLQHGNLYAAQSAQRIRRNLVTVKVVVSDRRAVTSAR
jgi:hypothetical protein